MRPTLFAVLLVVPTLRPADAAEPCAPALGEIVSVEGAVGLSRAGAAGFERALRGDLLCLGDAIRTGPLSRAAVALVNESVLRLDERSELVLRVGEPRERSLIEMVFGAIYFFSHRPRALQIDTPFVNAGAEGTEFLVRVDEDQTLIVVYDGRVVARNDMGKFVLGSGAAAVATAAAAPAPRTIARPRDLVAWAIYYPPILPPLARDAPRALPEGLAAAARAVAEGDYPQALARLDEVPEAARDARYFIYRAGVLLGAGRVEAANAAIERALALDPDAGDAFAQRSIIEVARNDVAAALADSERAVELAPASAPARIARSYALQAALRIEDAREALIEATRVAPEDALVFARLAEIELSRGDLDAALEAAERAVALEPDLARTQMVLGYAELVRIDTEDALEAFDRAILLDQANPLPHLGRGLAIIRDGDLDAGRRELEIAVALDPEDAVVRSYLGKAFFEERRDELAAEQLRIAKRLDPNDPTPWFYDAIRKQLENRPVEALRDLETAIAKNDNRAPYRSTFLLDQDLATRSVSLARIYDDLGFDQLAVTEASRSLSQDPSNWSAHRFLSDAYARLPRHEIARVSELLQAQLLQPININPVQPSLAYADLNIVEGIGPAEGAFNEFHPLFERDRVQLTATGVVGDGEGNEDTLGDEIVASALVDRFSLSAGQFHHETDGFRPNNDSETDLYDLFGQWAVTPDVNLQAEYRYRESEQGDLEFLFDPDEFFPTDRRDIRSSIGRLGARWSFGTAADVLVSAAYVDREERQSAADPDFTGLRVEDDRGWQVEAQTLYQAGWWNLVAGGGLYEVDVSFFNQGSFDFLPDFTREQQAVYAYGTLTPIDWLDLTLGLSYSNFKRGAFEIDEVDPKLGLRIRVTDWLELRAAYFETLKRSLAVDQTIEPTQVSGFNQFFDDNNGAATRNYGLAFDARVTENLHGGVEYVHRDVERPFINPFTQGLSRLEDQDENRYSAYVYWTPHRRWSLSVEAFFDVFERDAEEAFFFPEDLETFGLPVEARYFDPSGLFAVLGATYLRQDLERPGDAGPAEGTDDVVLVDAALGIRFPGRRGIASLESRNLLDEEFRFQDENFRSSEVRRSDIVPGRTVLARLTLNF